jgi:hypothetical protein
LKVVRNIAVGFLIGFFGTLLATSAGREVLITALIRAQIAGRFVQTKPMPPRPSRPGGTRPQGSPRPGSGSGNGINGLAILPFLPVDQQQPAADRLAEGMIRNDPEEGRLTLVFLLGFLEDALSQTGIATIGPGPDTVRPHIQVLYQLVWRAIPPGPPLVVDEED